MPHLARSIAILIGALALPSIAQVAKQPKLNDPALRLEALATAPDIEAPTTVCSSPDGAFYVGCDPRDTRLNTEKPECYIVRYSSMGADKKRTIFADKIYSPAGSLWYDGWLYVTHDPLLTRFKDTDGDGVADVREDLITDLGHIPYGGLNDHCVSGLTLGMDGYFYISVGDRGVYQAKAKDGKMLTMQGGGIIRCRPDGTNLEIFSTGTRNHLAVLLDAEDNAFTRDNTDDGNGWWTRLTHHIEGGYYGYPYDYQHAPNYGVVQPSQQTLDAMKRNGHEALISSNPQFSSFLPAMADFGGGSPTGGVCYLSDALPESYRGKLFFSEWGKGGIYVTEVARDGATFKLVKDEPLIQSEKGVDFRPMQISIAPDGSLLIADWAWGGWKAPKREGTIWRLSWPEAKPAPRLKDEKKATVEELIAELSHPDRNQRLRAQFELAARSWSSWQQIVAAIHNNKSDVLARDHALWSLEAAARIGKSNELEDVATRTLDVLLKSDNSSLRTQAARVIGEHNIGKLSSALFNLTSTADGPERLQILLALGRLKNLLIPNTVLLPELSNGDRVVRSAAATALRRINDWRFTGDPKIFEVINSTYNQAALAIPLASAQPIPAVPGIDVDIRIRAVDSIAHLAYKPIPWDGHWWGTQPVKSSPPPNSVPWEGTPKAVDALTKVLTDTDAGVRLAAAKAFSDFVLDPSQKSALEPLRIQLGSESDPAVRRQLIESLGVQRDPAAIDVFTKIALDEKADADFRDAAIGAVANIGGDAARKTMAQLVSANLSPKALRTVIEAVGTMKISEASAQLTPRLADANVDVRIATTKVLGSLGAKTWPAGTTEALLTLLNEKDNKLVTAAIETLGNAKVQAALPQFIELADKNKFRREVVTAMGPIADESAIPLLVKVLADKNSAVRRESAKTLKRFRSTAMPLVEQAIATHQIPAEFVPEIRNYFDSGIIEKWKLIGPFENVWEAIHPPEKDALAAGGKPDLGRKYTNAEGKEVGWHDANASTDDSRLDLAKVFNSTGMVCAYAWTEIDAQEAADTKLRCGSDDQIAIWINGQKVHNVATTRGFQADQDEVPVHFNAGKNEVFVKIGNLSGTWEFGVRIPGYSDGKFVKPKDLPPEEKQRNYALAMNNDGTWTNPGNGERGAKIFHDQTGPIGGICATCHTVRGKGGQIGPDLSAIGTNYRRPELLTSILEPSKTIALGFEQAIVETKGGEVFTGAQRQETNESLTLVGADSQPHIIKKSDIKSRKALEQSLMPPGLTMSLKPEDVADLLAYLESLKGQ